MYDSNNSQYKDKTFDFLNLKKNMKNLAMSRETWPPYRHHAITRVIYFAVIMVWSSCGVMILQPGLFLNAVNFWNLQLAR